MLWCTDNQRRRKETLDEDGRMVIEPLLPQELNDITNTKQENINGET